MTDHDTLAEFVLAMQRKAYLYDTSGAFTRIPELVTDESKVHRVKDLVEDLVPLWNDPCNTP